MNHKLWLAGTSLLLMVSVAANVAMFREMKSAYRDELAVRLNPIRWGQVFNNGERQERMFFGDSRIAMWPNLGKQENFGISNETTAQMIHRFGLDLALAKPRRVIIQAGINDLKAIGVMPERAKEITTATKTNISRMVDHAVASDAKVTVLTIFPTSHVPLWQRLFWSDGIETARLEVNKSLKSLRSKSVAIIDCDPILGYRDGRIDDKYALDLLHLNSAGYEKLNAALKIAK